MHGWPQPWPTFREPPKDSRAQHGTCLTRITELMNPSPIEHLAAIGVRPFIRGWLSANNYLFTDDAGSAIVVDTGYHSHAQQTVDLIAAALGSRPLTHIFNTHLHSDHCGGNAALSLTWPEAKVLVPGTCREAVSPWDEDALSYRFTAQSCPPFNVHGWLTPGSLVKLGRLEWQVLAAPGHDNDAVMLFEPGTRTLLSGDALWESRLAIVFPELSGESGYAEFHETLHTIESLEPALVLPGHGEPFTNVATALRQSREKLLRYEAQPDRHRQHAVRALLMFHMLEHHQGRQREQLVRWMSRTPVFCAAVGLESRYGARGRRRQHNHQSDDHRRIAPRNRADHQDQLMTPRFYRLISTE